MISRKTTQGAKERESLRIHDEVLIEGSTEERGRIIHSSLDVAPEPAVNRVSVAAGDLVIGEYIPGTTILAGTRIGG